MTPTTLCPNCGHHLFAFDMGQLVCNQCKNKISPIQHMIAEYVLKREKRGDFVVPTASKALMLAVTKIGEAISSYLLGVGADGYIRNREMQIHFAEKVGDSVFMLLMCAWLLDVQIEPAMWSKFNRKINNAETNPK